MVSNFQTSYDAGHIAAETNYLRTEVLVVVFITTHSDGTQTLTLSLSSHLNTTKQRTCLITLITQENMPYNSYMITFASIANKNTSEKGTASTLQLHA